MRWQRSRRSRNVEDRRGMRPGRALVGGGLGGLLLLLVAVLFGVDPGALLQLTGSADAPPAAETGRAGVPDDEPGEFVAAVLGDTEDVWGELFAANGVAYQPATIVLFTDAVSSACGMAGAAVGPFYCGRDERIYLDVAFFRELSQRFGAPGEFARAYVIAHEVGHHVQNLTGISRDVRASIQGLDEAGANRLSVRQELQADCFAGVWAHHAERARDILERGDVEAGLAAAAAIGDDRLQRRAQGYVVPESFTHGTSEQRVRWFRQGLVAGDPESCDTFEEGRI